MAHAIPREEAKRKLPNGWHDLIDEIYDLIEDADCEVMVINDKCGWLRTRVRGDLGQAATIRLARLEQSSDHTCMHCGHYGKRRARGTYLTLCEECEIASIEKRHGKTFDPFEET